MAFMVYKKKKWKMKNIFGEKYWNIIYLFRFWVGVKMEVKRIYKKKLNHIRIDAISIDTITCFISHLLCKSCNDAVLPKDKYYYYYYYHTYRGGFHFFLFKLPRFFRLSILAVGFSWSCACLLDICPSQDQMIYVFSIKMAFMGYLLLFTALE